MAEPWMKWAVAEGGTKTTSRVLQKFAGIAGGSLSGSLVTLLIIGVIQALGGLIGALCRRKQIRISASQTSGAVFFGLIASTMSVLGLFSFTYPEADVGITTFIITMSIIPGAFIDRIFFQNSLDIRQWLGIVVFLSAGYSVLNFPPLATLFVLPPWVVMTFGIALLSSFQEGITQWQARRKVNPIDHFVNNFWIGLTAVVYSLLAITLIGGWGTLRGLTLIFWIVSATIGINLIAMISFKLLAYKGGGSIALKKLIMQATYLVAATLLGWLVHGEPLTFGKILGMGGYAVAFTLMDRGTWQYLSGKFL